MKVEYRVIGESNNAYKVITKLDLWNSAFDEKTWIPKSVCKVEVVSKLFHSGGEIKKYKVVVWIDDWFYNKYL